MIDSFEDPLTITDRRKQPVCIRDMLQGQTAAFLIGGGPSVNSFNLELLNRVGVWSLAINNVAGHPNIRPNAFVCADPPKKFHYGIWKDPAIMKFLPIPKLKPGRGVLRKPVRGGGFEMAGVSTCHCPNVWGFLRRSWFLPDATFFTDPGASWGNLDAGVKRTGLPKTACTMLIGIRLLYYLGIRRIYLLGMDFKMTERSGYCFNQARDVGAVNSNNSQFAVVNSWMKAMQSNNVFEEFGLSLYNCYDQSGLTAFPFAGFVDAVEDCMRDAPQRPFDLAGWYEKGVNSGEE